MSHIGIPRYISIASALLLAALGACAPDLVPTLPDAVAKTDPTSAAALAKRFAEGYPTRGARTVRPAVPPPRCNTECIPPA